GDNDTGLLIDAGAAGSREGAAGDGTVLAMARGVLYGLSEATGRVRWATRVGVDATELPVKVPASAGRPEMVLLFSADGRVLSALDARDGSLIWKHTLDDPCPGPPAVVDTRIYVPTVLGQLLEIELSDGRLHGRFELGQRLASGGARME